MSPKRSFYLILCVAVLLVSSGCSYHGRVRQELYTPTANGQKASASLLVISDKNIPDKIILSAPTNAALYNFTLQTGEATLVALTDAFSAFVTQADGGPHTLEPNYDFVADINLVAELTRSNCASELKNLSTRQDGLCTQLTLILRRAGSNTPLKKFSLRRWSVFEKPGLASAVWYANKYTLYLLSPILLPTYAQLQGSQLRHQFEQHLREFLDEITNEISENPSLFSLSTEYETSQHAKNYVE